MREQQCLDPVLDAQLLLHEALALAVRSLAVLLLGCRHAHHAAHLSVAAQPGREHAQHTLSVEPVGFGSTRAAVHQDTGRLEHVDKYAVRRQQSMQPKPVPTRLEAARHLGGPSEFGQGARAQLRDQCEQRPRVASFDSMQPRLLGTGQARGDEPRREAELDGDVDGVLGRHGVGLPGLVADAGHSERSIQWCPPA